MRAGRSSRRHRPRGDPNGRVSVRRGWRPGRTKIGRIPLVRLASRNSSVEVITRRLTFPRIPLPANRPPSASGAAFCHFLLGVGDGSLEGLDVVAFGLADDFFHGAGHGGFDFVRRRVRVGDDQAGAADRGWWPRPALPVCWRSCGAAVCRPWRRSRRCALSKDQGPTIRRQAVCGFGPSWAGRRGNGSPGTSPDAEANSRKTKPHQARSNSAGHFTAQCPRVLSGDNQYAAPDPGGTGITGLG